MRSARMLRYPRLLLAVMLCLAATWLLAPGASAVGTLDQSQVSTPDTDGNFPDIQVAKTFTAGRTGALDQVDLHLGALATEPTGDLLVRIYALNGTTILEPPLASAIVPASSAPQPSADWVHVPLIPAAGVTAGSTYAIVAGSFDLHDTWTWSGDSRDDAYARGAAGVVEGGAFQPFEPPGGGDFAFKTYVSAPVTAASLCRDTYAALQSSPKYARNKKAVDAAASVLCGILAKIGPALTTVQKTKLVALYKAGLAPLVRSGWLTGAQAATLSATADRLAAGT